MDREIAVWLKLSKSAYIVPLLGTVKLFSPESLPVLVSEWMPSGTLDQYLEKYAETLTVSARVKLTRGVAGGLNYLRLENVVHGDLHPGNVLIDHERNPRLADFGLATVVGDPGLQWGSTTAARELNARWRAPEVLGIESDMTRPTFMSDIYSLGSIIFFITSGDKPWKEKKNSIQISVALSKKESPTRPEKISDNRHWNLIQKCWSWEPTDRPESTEVLENIRDIAMNPHTRRAPALHRIMHPLFTSTRFRSAPINYDVNYGPSPRTVLDRTTHSPVDSHTLSQPATDPPTPASSIILLRSDKFPWHAVVGPCRNRRSPDITNLDLLCALHEMLLTRVTPQEWEALGHGSKVQRKVTQAYEQRCTRLGGGWQGGVRRVDWLHGKTRLIGIEVEKHGPGAGSGRLVFGKA
ncbi:kinase-like domain-containing protein [Suillus discolor]|uniref:Kinase-like domain-containing protein n=1 Tax=Suillus discolor TaxID=1912936 RepID=A0A9P7F3Z9_9AGAM|nr:kinase-like domain-containing protein [Suillus discolor]KAG2105806.1 kinase-like domain-containing protein [Suillus discolor]